MAGPIILPSGSPKWPPTWGDGSPECCCGDRIESCTCLFCADCAWNQPTKAIVVISANYIPYNPGNGGFGSATGWTYNNPSGTYVLDPATFEDPRCNFYNLQTPICAGPWGMVLTGPPGRSFQVGPRGAQQWMGMKLGKTIGPQYGFEMFGICLGGGDVLRATFNVDLIQYTCLCPVNGLTTTQTGVDCSKTYQANFSIGQNVVLGTNAGYEPGTLTVRFVH